MFSTGFARDLAERTIATFAEALAALLLASGVGLIETGWVDALSLAGMTALIALLKGVGAYKLGDGETGASLLTEAPPRVEPDQRGESALVIIIAVAVVVLLLLLVVPALGR